MKQQNKVAGAQLDFPAFQYRWFMDINPVSKQRKWRKISNPNSLMRMVHARFLAFLRNFRLPMPSSTSGRLGDSALANVLRHKKRKDTGLEVGFNRYLVLMDISSAYQAVDLERMVDVILRIRHDLVSERESVRDFLREYCFDPQLGGLVTGAPSSQDLFNLYCEVLIDRQLRDLSERYGLVYSRYLDDLTFSSLGPIGLKKRRALRAVLQDAGFKISDKKAQVIDLRKGPAVLNGVGICLDGRIFLPRKTLDHIRGLIHQALTRRNIKPAIIHGKMGLLKGVTNRLLANRTEAKVYRMYELFQMQQRALREEFGN